MAYGVKYRLPFTNQLGEDYDIQFRLKDYTGDALVFRKGSKDTLQIRSFNNDDDRFSPIISKECIISINLDISTGAISIEDFLAEQDDQWYVTVYRESTEPPIFEGFLLVEDSSEPLLDKPIDITIRANDGLALLKNVPLKMADGNVFTGYNSFTDYIGNILYYINPDIHFRIYFDIYHTSMDINECPLEQCGVAARTFEQDETTFKDSYAVLEEIMKSLECRIFYENGYWHIVSIWQYQKDYGFNWTEYTMTGNAATKVTSAQNEFHIASIGNVVIEQNQKFVNKDALKYYKVATKSVKLTYNYDIPKELICNQHLGRGTAIPGLSGAGWEGLTHDCWDHVRWRTAFSPLNVAYIKREFDVYNYEKDRYLILPTETSGVGSAQFLSSMFYIGEGDKIDISVETKLQNGYSGGQNSLVFYVLLFGDDGTFWTLDDNGTAPDNEGLWVESNFNFGINRKAISYVYGAGDDKTLWVTASVNSSPAPVNGSIQLVLSEHSFASFPNATWFKNIGVTYHPYVKNSYFPVKGDYNLYNQNLKINKTIDEQVTISDSPKKITKGAIFLSAGILATPQWFRTGFNESLRFTQIMALIKYTYSYRQYAKVEGTVKGLSLIDTSDNNIPFGFLPQYSLTDLGQSTTRYILTSVDINYNTGHWRGVLVEVQLSPVATYDNYDFSYIF